MTDFRFAAYGFDPMNTAIECTKGDFSYPIWGKTLAEVVGIANDHAELAHG